jgi:hypothetical protein
MIQGDDRIQTTTMQAEVHGLPPLRQHAREAVTRYRVAELMARRLGGAWYDYAELAGEIVEMKEGTR